MPRRFRWRIRSRAHRRRSDGMKILKRLLYAIVGLIAALPAIGLLLPNSAHVERSVTTTASPDTVYGIVNGFARFNEWSPWAGLDPGRSVTTRLDFGSQGTATSKLEVVPEADGSRITWSFDTSFEGDFLGRYFGLLVDRMIGADYEKGLSRLEALAEATERAAAAG